MSTSPPMTTVAQPVVDQENSHPGGPAQPRRQLTVAAQRSEAVAATVEVHQDPAVVDAGRAQPVSRNSVGRDIGDGHVVGYRVHGVRGGEGGAQLLEGRPLASGAAVVAGPGGSDHLVHFGAWHRQQLLGSSAAATQWTPVGVLGGLQHPGVTLELPSGLLPRLHWAPRSRRTRSRPVAGCTGPNVKGKRPLRRGTGRCPPVRSAPTGHAVASGQLGATTPPSFAPPRFRSADFFFCVGWRRCCGSLHNPLEQTLGPDDRRMRRPRGAPTKGAPMNVVRRLGRQIAVVTMRAGVKLS